MFLTLPLMTEGPDGFQQWFGPGEGNILNLAVQSSKKNKALNGTEEEHKQKTNKYILCLHICHLETVTCCVSAHFRVGI